MTTVASVLTQCAAQRPDGLREQDKARQVIELDERIYHELTGSDCPDQKPVTCWPEQGEEPLLIQGAYAGLYTLWLQAYIEFELGNYEAYNALAARFGDLYTALRTHWRQSHRPRSAGGVTV